MAASTGLLRVDPPPAVAAVERRPRRLPTVLVVLGAATVAAAVLEGTPGDWGAVQLDRLDVSDGLAPLATAAFMGGMFAGRLVGDRRTDRHGGAVVLRRGMALCAVGLAVGAAWGEPLPFVAGVALAGFGLSGFFPLAFSAAARVPGIAGGVGAAVVSLAARAGFLVEPPVVGAVAEATDLRVSFALAAVVAAAHRAGRAPDRAPARTPSSATSTSGFDFDRAAFAFDTLASRAAMRSSTSPSSSAVSSSTTTSLPLSLRSMMSRSSSV